MLTLSDTQKENEALARQINEEARRVPGSRYAGKWVALLEGKVVDVADSPERALAKLRELQPDRRRGVIIEASRDYGLVDYIKADSNARHCRR
jgi:hypothetical protein